MGGTESGTDNKAHGVFKALHPPRNRTQGDESACLE